MGTSIIPDVQDPHTESYRILLKADPNKCTAVHALEDLILS